MRIPIAPGWCLRLYRVPQPPSSPTIPARPAIAASLSTLPLAIAVAWLIGDLRLIPELWLFGIAGAYTGAARFRHDRP